LLTPLQFGFYAVKASLDLANLLPHSRSTGNIVEPEAELLRSNQVSFNALEQRVPCFSKGNFWDSQKNTELLAKFFDSQKDRSLLPNDADDEIRFNAQYGCHLLADVSLATPQPTPPFFQGPTLKRFFYLAH